MSRFSGPQFKGAKKQFKAKQRAENEERDRKWREWDAVRTASLEAKAASALEWEAFIMGDTDVMPASKGVHRSIFGDVDLATGNISYLGGVLVEGQDF